MLILFPTALEAGLVLDGAAPRDEHAADASILGVRVRSALCGFGPVAAGVLGGLAVARERPTRCVLAGIAGTYDPMRLPIGALLEPAEARMADVGRGRGSAALDPRALGFPQVPEGPEEPAVYDRLPLYGSEQRHGVLLTVASASGSLEEAAERRARHPDASAEDMEGFGVALACSRLRVPLTILRGISNVAGDADRSRWSVEGTLVAVRVRLAELTTGSA